MINTKKAIFYDIDGTLLHDGQGPFENDLKPMEEAVRAGHRLFLNSGRSFSNIPGDLLDLHLWSGVAAGAGSHVLLAESAVGVFSGKKPSYKTIYHKWVSKELLKDLCAWYLKSQKCMVLEGEKDCYVINPHALLFCDCPAKIITKPDDFQNKYPDDLITKLTIQGKVSSSEKKFLEGILKVTTFGFYAEAIVKGESKAKAMGILLKAAGIKRVDSIAVGDSANDIDMIRFAGLGIAMGNADPEVKAAARAITGKCGEGGAGEILKRFVL